MTRLCIFNHLQQDLDVNWSCWITGYPDEADRYDLANNINDHYTDDDNLLVEYPECEHGTDQEQEDKDDADAADGSHGQPGAAELVPLLNLPDLPGLVVAYDLHVIQVLHFAALALNEVKEGPGVAGAVVRVPEWKER